MAHEFFANEKIQHGISKLLRGLAGFDGDGAKHVYNVLSIIQNNAQAFDERCQVNIEWIGSSISNRLANGIGDQAGISDLISMLFRIVCEFELSSPGELSMELRSFQAWVHDNASKLGENEARQVDFARHQMPVSIIKNLLGFDVVRNLPNIQKYVADIGAKFKEWDGDLLSREGRVNELRDALKKHESGFNFVGLHKGFDDLSKVKADEVRGLRWYVMLLGFGVLMPLSIELILLFHYRAEVSSMNLPLLLSLLPAVSLTVILIYYFRLAVRSFESAKAQLSQIELRKTMCRFVESYADFAKRMKADNAETLGKFESMIFSNIVGSDEKLPATFDGVEQLSALIKSVKS